MYRHWHDEQNEYTKIVLKTGNGHARRPRSEGEAA